MHDKNIEVVIGLDEENRPIRGPISEYQPTSESTRGLIENLYPDNNEDKGGTSDLFKRFSPFHMSDEKPFTRDW